MLRILIIDDEAPTREMIVNILQMAEMPLEVVGQADSVASGLEQIKTPTKLKPLILAGLSG